jgi:hypothetical protein
MFHQHLLLLWGECEARKSVNQRPELTTKVGGNSSGKFRRREMSICMGGLLNPKYFDSAAFPTGISPTQEKQKYLQFSINQPA